MPCSAHCLLDLLLLFGTGHHRHGDEPVGRQRPGVLHGVEHAAVDATDQHDDVCVCRGVR